MPACFLGVMIVFGCLSFVPVAGQERMPWPGSAPEGRLERKLDPLQVQSIVDSLNEESQKQYSEDFIVKYYLDLGPLNRVQVNPQLWKRLSLSERRQLGNRFAKAFKGTGLLFCQFFAGDALVGKVKSDPIRGGLKFELAN